MSRRSWALVASLLILAALVAAVVWSRPSDRALYLGSLELTPVAAHAQCGRIADPTLRADCRHANVERAGEAHYDGIAPLCEDFEPGRYAEDCWYLAASGERALGERAATLCARAGPFAGHCVFDALRREAGSLLAELDTVGQEQTAWQTLRERAAWFQSQELPVYYGAFPGHTDGSDDALDKIATELVLRGMSARLEPRGRRPARADSLRLELCGATTTAFCAAAYSYATYRWSTMTDHPSPADVERICATDPTRAEVDARGGIPWEADAQEVAIEAWAWLCPRVTRGKSWDGMLGWVFGASVFDGDLDPFGAQPASTQDLGR